MNRFRGLVKSIIVVGWLAAGCSNPKPNLQAYTGRYQKAVKEQTNYVDVTEKKGELILTASWDNYEKPLWYLNGDNFMVKGFGWAIKFNRGYNKQINGFIMTGDALWQKVNRDSSDLQLQKWQIFADSAKLHAHYISPKHLQSVAGNYGNMQIIVQDDHAFSTTSKGDRSQLYPIDNNLFVTDGYTLKSIKAQKADTDKIEIHYKNGYTEILPRVK
jgi:mannosyltransferase OCH1-like enzyme